MKRHCSSAPSLVFTGCSWFRGHRSDPSEDWKIHPQRLIFYFRLYIHILDKSVLQTFVESLLLFQHDSAESQPHKETVFPVWCGRTWLVCTESWPQPGFITQHQRRTSVTLSWLNGTKSLHSQVPKIWCRLLRTDTQCISVEFRYKNYSYYLHIRL